MLSPKLMISLVVLWITIDPTFVFGRHTFLPKNRTLATKRREQSKSAIRQLRRGDEGRGDGGGGSCQPPPSPFHPGGGPRRGDEGHGGGGDGSCQPGSFSIPFNDLLLKKIYERVRLLPSLGCWWYLIVSRKNLLGALRNMIFWSTNAVVAMLLAMNVLARHIAILHVYDPSDVAVKNSTENGVQNLDPFYGLNVAKQKFRAWVGYHLGDVNCLQDDAIKTRLYFVKRRAIWREGKLQETWREGRLLIRRSPFRIELPKEKMAHICDLYIYVLKDELEDDRDHSKLMAFLHTEYGPNITRLEATNWNKESNNTQLKIMQEFLDWFRSTFPYYYDTCDACDASSLSVEGLIHTFLGISCPNSDESMVGKAKQVEFFGCPKCGSVTRFPRFNAAMPICENRRGRCGEYSLLLLRMLQALGHTCRYVVDLGNDHIWSEVQWDGATTRNNTNRRWLHLDPCEAAVNKNLLYQEWGRHLTSVFAFCAPPFVFDESHHREAIPIIEDVTDNYKSQRSWFRWRQKTIDEVSVVLHDKIDNLQNSKE